VAQFASAGGSRSSATVLTVADILRRNAPVPVKAHDSLDSAPLSVGSLLRREGRATHALDRPLKPRASQAEDETTLVPRTAPVTRRTVKGGAIAAGSLLAAGSVFGATVLTDTPADQDSATGPYAGHGILDGTADAGSTPTVAISPAANTGGLDAGAGAPSSWVPVAFPSALAGSSDGAAKPGTTAKAPSTGTPAKSSGTGSPTGSTGGGSGTGGTTGGGNSGGSGGTTGGTPSSSGVDGTVTSLTGRPVARWTTSAAPCPARSAAPSRASAPPSPVPARRSARRSTRSPSPSPRRCSRSPSPSRPSWVGWSAACSGDGRLARTR